MTYEYENLPRKCYGDDEDEMMYFVPVCPKCRRFVKADETVKVNGHGRLSDEPNATCKKCGRVNMPFEGWL